jgi:galactokinase
MDLFIAFFGKAKHALLIDCRSLQKQLLPLSDQAKIVVCNTKVKHNLAGGEYNERRAGCEAAVQILRQRLPGIRALRDVSLEQLEEHGRELTPEILRLARHVVTENERVQAACAALGIGDLARFGELMYESHRSLRDDYRVSCKELDILVDIASKTKGTIGARMTGGGFGGCTVNLVEQGLEEVFVEKVGAGYKEATGIGAEIYICEAAEGARTVKATAAG